MQTHRIINYKLFIGRKCCGGTTCIGIGNGARQIHSFNLDRRSHDGAEQHALLRHMTIIIIIYNTITQLS